MFSQDNIMGMTCHEKDKLWFEIIHVDISNMIFEYLPMLEIVTLYLLYKNLILQPYIGTELIK